jgi:ABC-2 type transport system ATP-binding protein
MTPPTPVISVSNLTHRYGERVALAGVSIEINEGEIFGFLGPNGSGKTTLFRVLSTLIAPPANVADGSVRVAGFDLRTSREAVRRMIGVVFQSPSLDKQLTAAENLRHHGHLYGLRGAELEKRIDEMLRRVGLAERPRELVARFSGGMRRRVELAKGLLTRPAILLLDEPSTGLDPGARIDLWRYLREIREAGRVTILVTTHLMDEAEQCDRLAIMDGGRVAACDATAALKARIGADVITLTVDDPAGAAATVRDRFGIAAEVVGAAVRIERERGHEFVPALVEALAGRGVRSVSLGKPTLEDVFIRVTGHGFLDDGDLGARG